MRAHSHTPRHRHDVPRARRAFSLVELAIVVVVIGVIGAIAIPRVASAAENSRIAALEADQALLQKALDLYAVEHGGLTANHDPDGTACGDADSFIARLTSRTDELGRPDSAGLFGPYLRAVPKNTFAARQGVRFDGAVAAQDFAWRFDSATNTIAPDQARALVSPRTGRTLGPSGASSSGTLGVSGAHDGADAGTTGTGGVSGRGGSGTTAQTATTIEN